MDNRERNCLCSLSQSSPQGAGMNKHLGKKKRELVRNKGTKNEVVVVIGKLVKPLEVLQSRYELLKCCCDPK